MNDLNSSTTDKSFSLLDLIWRHPLLPSLVFSGVLFAAVVNVSISELHRDFTIMAKGANIDMREHVHATEGIVENAALLFLASQHVTAEEFSIFSNSQFVAHDDIDSLHFLLNVAQTSRYRDHGSWRDAPLLLDHDEIALHQLYRVSSPKRVIATAWDIDEKALLRALEQDETVVGETATVLQEVPVYTLYKSVRASVDAPPLGVVILRFRPHDILHHIAEDYLINARLFVGEQQAGEAGCCNDDNGLLLPRFESEAGFDFGNTQFRLAASRGVTWEDIHLKVAVLAFIVGVILSVAMYRLRMANQERTRLLLERNRIIKRQVEEQMRALRQANKELEQQKAALDEHAIVSIADITGNITYVNEKFCQISGYRSEELLGRNHRIVKSDRHSPAFYAQMWETISQGNVWHGDVCNRTRDGAEYWVSSTIVPFLDERGIPYQYVSIRTDVTPIVDAEAALTRSEQEVASILDTVPALIWFKDADNRVIRANRMAADMVGCRPEEIAGRPYSDFFPSEIATHCHQDDLKVILSGEPMLDVREEMPGSDRVHYFRVDRVPYRDENGAIIGLIVMAYDVTEQEETERALLLNEVRLRRSQTFANIGTWDWNVQTGDLYWSERIAPLFGYEEGELETTYENFINAVHPDDRDAVTSAVTACVESGTEYNIEHRVVWPDGQTRWLSEKGDVVRDKQGKPLHMLGVVSDIHERKMAEVALGESEEKYRRLFELSEDPMWMILGEQFVMSNAAAAQVLGYDNALELNNTHPSVLSPEFQEDGQSSFEKANAMMNIAYREGYNRFEWLHERRNGEVLPVEVSLTRVPYQGQEALFCVWRDITESKKMQQNLLTAKETAEQASRAKSEFLSSMSHELRTPLNAILGFTQLMAGDANLTVEQRDNLSDIGSAGGHLLDLINDVLDLAKIEAGKMELSVDNIALSDVMAAAKKLIAPMAERRSISLDFNDADLGACVIRADFIRVKQVLINILSNAVKYNRDNGTITVRYAIRPNGCLRISVSDTGEGIPEVKLRNLFEAFNRLDAEGSNIEGTGIGLVITRQLVELMGGTMGVESVVTEGSTFWFELPRTEGDSAQRRELTEVIASDDAMLGAGRSVLYIEDNPVNLKLVSKLVEKRTALKLLTAEEPVSGIEQAIKHRPDLILLDINLPEMNGFEVLRHLRDTAETRDIPVVALSANAMADDLRRGEEAGFDGYLTKPIDIKAFFAVLETQLGV